MTNEGRKKGLPQKLFSGLFDTGDSGLTFFDYKINVVNQNF